MRVLSLNIWNYNPPWTRRREAIVDLIRREQAHVVALQEVHNNRFRNARGNNQAAQIARSLGWHVVYQPAMVYLPLPRVEEGLAILAPEPMTDMAFQRLSRDIRDPLDLHRRIVLRATVQSVDERLCLCVTHLSLSARARSRTVREVAQFAQSTPDSHAALLVGDFNAPPESDVPQFITGDIAIGGLTGDFADLATVHSICPENTFRSDRPARRIDYMFIRQAHPRPLETVVREFRVIGSACDADGIRPSDHCGLLADLDLAVRE